MDSVFGRISVQSADDQIVESVSVEIARAARVAGAIEDGDAVEDEAGAAIAASAGQQARKRDERREVSDARGVAGIFFERRHDGFVARQALVVRALEASERALVVLRDHAHELRQLGGPGREDPLRVFTARVLHVLLDERAQLARFRRVFDAFDVDHLRVDARGELVVLVEHVGDAA